MTNLPRIIAYLEKYSWIPFDGPLYDEDVHSPPPDETDVLFFIEASTGNRIEVGKVSRRCGTWGPSLATHWMPLPAPPAITEAEEMLALARVEVKRVERLLGWLGRGLPVSNEPWDEGHDYARKRALAEYNAPVERLREEVRVRDAAIKENDAERD